MTKNIQKTTMVTALNVFALTQILLLTSILSAPINAAPQVNPTIIQQNREQQKLLESDVNKRLKKRQSVDSGKLQLKNILLLPKGQCHIVKQIFAYGADKIPSSKLQSIINSNLNQCLNNSKITKLVTEIQNWYLKAGFITTRVTVKNPQNSFSEKGNLELWVYEGQIGEFILNNNSNVDNSRIKTAFPIGTGDILNIHDLDQGLEQLNKLFSQKFKMQIKPATRPGYSDIVLIELTATTKITQQIVFNYTNGGTKSTGEDLYNIKYSKENLLGLNDSISVSLQQALPDISNKSESIRINANVPYGYWNFKFNYNLGSTIRTINSNTIPFKSKSDIQTTQLSASRVYSRTQKSKLELNSMIEFSDRKSFINDTLITVSSRQIASVDFGLLYTRYFQNSTLILSPSISNGVALFGAIKDAADINKNQAHAEYNIIKLYSYYRYQIFPFSRYRFYLQNSINVQYSDKALYGEKQFVLGGEYSIRGFKENVMSSDSGISMRNDIILPIGHWMLPWIKKPLIAPLTLKFHYDIGEGYPFVDGKRKSISGWAIGINYNYKWFTVSLTSAAPIINPDIFVEKQSRVTYLNFNANFLF